MKSEKVVETQQVREYDFSKGFINLADQAKMIEEETIYERAVTEKRSPKKTPIEYRMYPAEDVAQDIVNKFKARDLEIGTSYSKKYPFDKILTIIQNSLKGKGKKESLVSQENKQRILQAFGVIERKGSKSLRYKVEAENLSPVRTGAMNKRSLGVGALRREHSVFFDDHSLNDGDEKDRKLLKELLEDEELPRYALQRVENTFNFKTPVNVVFVSHKPERDFTKRLVSEENTRFIDAWVKSPDVGFYSIDYSWRKGEHPEHEGFNPDFFIRVGDDILVVEI